MSEKHVFSEDEEYIKKFKKGSFNKDHFLIEPINKDNIAIIGTIPIDDPEIAEQAWNAIKKSPVGGRKPRKPKRGRTTKPADSFPEDDGLGDDLSELFDSDEDEDDEKKDDSFFF